MKENSENTALYTTIYTELRKQIFTGSLHPGDLIPSESKLCKEYNASRDTVRKALKMLENDDLIYSRPKVGYFVSTPNGNDFKVSFSEFHQNCTAQYIDIHGILPDEHVRKALGITAEQKVIELAQIIQNPEGVTVALEIKYIPYEKSMPSVEGGIHYAVLPDIAFSKMDSYDYYSDVSISAVAADDKLAEFLECSAGAPLLLIERVVFTQEKKRTGYFMYYSRSEFEKLPGKSGPRI